MAIHSSILAWEISWTEETGGLQSMGLRRVRHDLVTTKTTICRFLGCRIDHLVPTSPLLLPFQHIPAPASLCLRGLRPRDHPCSSDSWVGKIPSRGKWLPNSSFLAWRIPWAEATVGLQSMGLRRVRHNGATNTHTLLYYISWVFFLSIKFCLCKSGCRANILGSWVQFDSWF